MPDCKSSLKYFFETQQTFFFPPQESNKIGFVFTGETHTGRKGIAGILGHLQLVAF